MLKINLENELLKIEKSDIDLRIKKAIINPKIESKIFRIKKINYSIIIGLFIVGVIIICVGAFFQDSNKRPIMISCIVIGVLLIISILIPAFIAPWISFKLLKKSALKHINETFIVDIFNIFSSKIENIKFINIIFIDKYIQMSFQISDYLYEIKKQENKIILNFNDQIINSQKLKNYFTSHIKYKLSVVDMYKQSNMENFISFISDEIKHKFQMILKDISFMINSK